MNPDDRRLLLEWLEHEESGDTPLDQRLQQLSDHRKDLAPLFRFLRGKLAEESARRALRDREQWHRSLSFRLISLLFGISGLSLLGFALWGEEQAFFAALFFFTGLVIYYLAAQILVTLRSQRAAKSWKKIRRDFLDQLESLRRKL